MMPRLYLTRRVLWWMLLWISDRFGVVPVPRDRYLAARLQVLEVIQFCAGSGFLRDGRYPGGRPAERKLRSLLAPLELPTVTHCERFPTP